MSAALHYKRRTGRGVYLDLSQVEAAAYTLAPWLLDYAVNGHTGAARANRSESAAPHGAFPCAGDDAWVAIAVWSDAEWRTLADLTDIHDTRFAQVAGRLDAVDALEERLSAWTRTQPALVVAERLQAAGLEAVPVQSFPEVFDDPQLAARDHLDRHAHAALGACAYERNGFRLSDAPSGYVGPAPMLGEHSDLILGGFLGYSAAEIATLRGDGGVE